MNQKKIAELAGVSVSTVSKVLSDSKEIGEDTKRKVMEVIEKSNYLKDKKRIKSSYKSGKVVTVAVLVPELVSVHYARMVTKIDEVLRENGARAAIFVCGFSLARKTKVLEECALSREYDAIISLMGATLPYDSPVPIVSTVDTGKYDCVAVNYESGIKQCLESFAKFTTDVGYIGETNTTEKNALFTELATELGVYNSDNVYINGYRFEAIGIDAANNMIKLNRVPKAILCAYDEIAVGAISVLSGAGYRIPEDVRVVGINDVYSECLGLELSTICVNMTEQCEDVISLLLEKVHNKSYKTVRHVTVDSYYEQRNT